MKAGSLSTVWACPHRGGLARVDDPLVAAGTRRAYRAYAAGRTTAPVTDLTAGVRPRRILGTLHDEHRRAHDAQGPAGCRDKGKVLETLQANQS